MEMCFGEESNWICAAEEQEDQQELIGAAQFDTKSSYQYDQLKTGTNQGEVKKKNIQGERDFSAL